MSLTVLAHIPSALFTTAVIFAAPQQWGTPTEAPLDLIDRERAAMQDSEPDLGFEAEVSPDLAPGETVDLAERTSCKTDCTKKCTWQDCWDYWYFGWHTTCTPAVVNPACKATCEGEKAFACAKLQGQFCSVGHPLDDLYDKYDEVIYDVIGYKEYQKIFAAASAAAATAGVASSAVFWALYDSVTEVLWELAAEVGEKAAAQYVYGVLSSGGDVTIKGLTIGIVRLPMKLCYPNCDNSWAGCVPALPQYAVHVSWNW
ncbi:hypothetical protein [Nannocystis pusilla]|uniref:Uncharacterized protein n=1 Tax=Nannocystis pusilla TaxID=889268 RepID=A0ABS7U616_9BACT|nr:hypothetical protein [Nannocystis pusilla]MBZ5715909.1 hypothetical protein [Nannocystis pusilla]